jgi:AraC family transcriptional regulator, regulatory protein of adaptative response / methylated-DNA-[protein]-cysteine methyltransferase
MNEQANFNFQRIAKAIDFLQKNYQSQPELEEIAKHVQLSPFHFQRLFTEWAGISPKQFSQYLSLQHAKNILQNQQTLLNTTHQTGLSSTSRLHDLFIKIEGITPGEYKNGGENLLINYSYADSPFGQILLASTNKGLCYMAFADDEIAFEELQQKFPQAKYQQKIDSFQQNALKFFTKSETKKSPLKLHLKGTPFQIKVWEALLTIPAGQLSTYGKIAQQINNPKACRAVGTAIGDNPISYLIPCHRVIQSTGIFGNYHWGPQRKTAMIGWEAAQQKSPETN